MTDTAHDSCDDPSPVCSYTEWDPLEEIIVGRLDGAVLPSSHIAVTYRFPPVRRLLYRVAAGHRYPGLLVRPARRQLDEFMRILEEEGVTVRQPDAVRWRTVFKTPLWRSRGFCSACPRDGFLVVGNEIIESPMAWRTRHFEGLAYRRLFQMYFDRGAHWTAAPRPELADALYDRHYRPPPAGRPQRYVINESEPVFDAADLTRCGRDLFVQRSNVTNAKGIDWLRGHLGDTYRIHEVETTCPNPMHIDSTFVPLAPGKLMINPAWMRSESLPPLFKSWEVRTAPDPDPLPRGALDLVRWTSMVSKWINLNVLMLDERRVIVEETQGSMIRFLRDWGFETIPCAFMHYTPFGGSFHCATLDVRRRGELQSYF